MACGGIVTVRTKHEDTHRQVDGDDVSKPLTIVEKCGEIRYHHDQGGWNINGHELTEDIPLEKYLDRNTFHSIFKCSIFHGGSKEVVLDDVPGSIVWNGVWWNQLKNEFFIWI